MTVLVRANRPTESHAVVALTPEEKAALRKRYPLNDAARFADDPAARAFVADHPDGATLGEIASLWDCSGERIRQIEEKAAANFARRLQLLLRGQP